MNRKIAFLIIPATLCFFAACKPKKTTEDLLRQDWAFSRSEIVKPTADPFGTDTLTLYKDGTYLLRNGATKRLGKWLFYQKEFFVQFIGDDSTKTIRSIHDITADTLKLYEGQGLHGNKTIYSAIKY